MLCVEDAQTCDLILSVLHFVKGLCDKGKKCKFSHDKKLNRKAEKANLYVDQREDNSGS